MYDEYGNYYDPDAAAGTDPTFMIWALLFWALAIILCGIIASRKGRSVGWWVIGGVMFSWVGVLIVACLSTTPEKEAERQEAIDWARNR